MMRKLARWWNSRRQTTDTPDISPLRRLQAESLAANERHKQRLRKLAPPQRKRTALDDTLQTALGNTYSALEAGRASLATGADAAGKVLDCDEPLDSSSRARRASWFARLIAWLHPARNRIERRRQPRFVFGRRHPHLRLTLGVCGWPAAVTDVSQTGVGLIVGMWQKPGNLLQLHVTDESRGWHWDVRAKVHRVEQRPDGLWRLGCCFQRPVNERELAALK
ncbi:MAG: PilZ domain-containing protein [Planctomycetia bacterium]|nr:PilZ domain-containing protein [Planctomycetia bacterium]